MTTENVETKVVETVAENKETIAKVLSKGTDHKKLWIAGSAIGLTAIYVGLSALAKKVSKKKEEKVVEETGNEDLADTLKEAAETLKEEVVNIEKK